MAAPRTGTQRGPTSNALGRFRSNDDGEQYCALGHRPAFDAAIEECAGMGLIEALRDDFGPDLYLISANFGEGYAELERAYEGLFRKYMLAGQSWLVAALDNIMEQHHYGFTESEKSEPVDWQPIPVERDSQSLQAVTSALDAAIEAVRGDNGYSATQPEERRFVLDNLQSFRKTLADEAQIGWMYVRECGLRPLALLIDRFRTAATGLAASAAREAIVGWLKDFGIDILKFLGR